MINGRNTLPSMRSFYGGTLVRKVRYVMLGKKNVGAGGLIENEKS